ncbi:MAG: glycosyltransferase family 2 protein [Candidatus Margulisiibacteriota bacterium]
MSEKPRLSLVIPVFNEAENLLPLHARLAKVLKNSYEIIFIDDGSTDNSLQVITTLHNQDFKVKAVSFSRNFGHMAALSAGLDVAQGDAVIMLDADLQHPPELVPELVRQWENGAEVVNTIRQETKGAGQLKGLTAGLFYWLINRIAKINLPAGSADYRLLDRKVVDTLKNVRERSRFLRGLISWIGFRQTFVEYEAEARTAGQSKYSFGKMFSFALDGITSFSAVPLRLSTYLGLAVAGLSFLYILYAVYIRLFTSRAIEGWTSVLVTVLFIGGIQLIFLGVIGEYLSRVFEETKQRPLYIISRQIGL